jgi:hypothetical protein
VIRFYALWATASIAAGTTVAGLGACNRATAGDPPAVKLPRRWTPPPAGW